MTFLPPLLTFSSRIRLDCIAQASLGLHTRLEVECLYSWIHWLHIGNAPLWLVASSYAEAMGMYSTATSYDRLNFLALSWTKGDWLDWLCRITWIWLKEALLVFSSALSVSFLGFLMRARGSSMTGVQYMWVGRGLVGLGVGLRVCGGLCWLLNAAGAALWASLLRLIARSRLKQLFQRGVMLIAAFFFKQNLHLMSHACKMKAFMGKINQQFNQPFLQSQTSLVASLAFDRIHGLGSSPVMCHMSVPVFASEMRLTCKSKIKVQN